MLWRTITFFVSGLLSLPLSFLTVASCVCAHWTDQFNTCFLLLLLLPRYMLDSYPQKLFVSMDSFEGFLFLAERNGNKVQKVSSFSERHVLADIRRMTDQVEDVRVVHSVQDGRCLGRWVGSVVRALDWRSQRSRVWIPSGAQEKLSFSESKRLCWLAVGVPNPRSSSSSSSCNYCSYCSYLMSVYMYAYEVQCEDEFCIQCEIWTCEKPWADPVRLTGL